MTAIFAVWNTRGVAIAADRTVSIVAGNGDVLSTEYVDKLARLEGHKIIVALASDVDHNGIPILNLVQRWCGQLNTPLDTVDEYAASFLQWLIDNKIDASPRAKTSMLVRAEKILRTFTQKKDVKKLQKQPQIRKLINSWKAREPINVFFPPSNYDQMLSDRLQIAEPREQRVLNSKGSIIPKVTGSEIADDSQVVLDILEEAFMNVFDREVNYSLKSEFNLMQDLAGYIMGYIDEEQTYSQLLFAGYGEKQWLPHAVEITLHNFPGILPRAAVANSFHPSHVWYIPLAAKEQVSTFLRGASPELEKATRDSEIRPAVDYVVDERISIMNRKANDLSKEKLEFVARSFVELESLGAFLVEDLPTVGGEVQVISIER